MQELEEIHIVTVYKECPIPLIQKDLFLLS